MIARLALAVILVASPAAAQQRKAFEFRGHRLGDAKWDEPLACSVIQGLTTDQMCYDHIRIGTANAVVTYWFFGTRLGRVSLSYDPEDFDEIALAFKEKFGPPRVTASVETNPMGARFTNRAASWRTAGGLLMVMKYGRTFEQGYGEIAAAWAEKLETQRKAEERKRNGI